MYHLTYSQQNILLSEQSADGLPVNTLHTTVAFLEETDPYLLKKAVDFIIKSADVFKIRLLYDNGQMVQIFDSTVPETCAVDERSYTCEQIHTIFKQKKEHVFNLNERLYEFIIYQINDGTCILSITNHHIMMDGYGVGILCKKIVKAYAQLLKGNTLSNTCLPFEKTIKSFPDKKETSDFWESYFDGYETGVQPYLLKGNYVLASAYKGIIKNTDILRFCADISVTPYTVFTAALALYITTISQSDEAIIIVPRMNRSLEERDVIGNFVLPVPMRIKKNDCFASMCKQVMEEGRRVTSHKEYSFSKIIEDFKKRFYTDKSVSDFTLNFQRASVKSEVNTKTNFSTCGAMNNAVTINISNYEDDDLYEITYDYREDIIKDENIEFLHNSLVSIIDRGIAGVKTDEINIVTKEEQNFLNKIFNGKKIKYSTDETIVSLFDKAVLNIPNKTAVISEDRSYTYSEINNLSNRIANGLINRKIEKNSLVAFLLPRDSTLIPTMLGILKAGCFFLPLDINYPKGRIDYIIENSNAKIIISTQRFSKEFDIPCTDVNELIATENDCMPSVCPAQNDLAYCIYTSGTSGRPKGVLIEHRGIVNIVKKDNNAFNEDVCENGKGIVAIGSICFDISLFEIFVFLLNEKFVVLVPDDNLANGEKIAEYFHKTDANTLHCTPSRLQNYITGRNFADVLKSKIDIVLSAGEVLSAGLAKTIAENHVRVYNGYGPTEVTIGAAITEAGDIETIGRPIANTTICILNDKHEILPMGVTGEIAIAGDGVGRGYLNNQTLTNEKFVIVKGVRMYMTGDLGCFIPDGRLKYSARIDNQIKLRGFRIELSEIEKHVLDYNGISSCAVVVTSINHERHLVLYYSSDNNVEEDDLKVYLREFLSYYMIPEVIVKLETMPVNNNGKIDRDALTQLPVIISKKYIPPQTENERIICEAFRLALSVDRVGIEDNFFEIGGTSLLAAKVMVYMKKQELNIEYSAIFRYPTPKLLAKNIKKPKLVNCLDLFYKESKNELYGINSFLPDEKGNDFSLTDLGHVLLTGATGFLGIHILKLLIDDESDDKIYCIVRKSGRLSSEERLRSLLFYYFGNMFEDSFRNRIEIIEGDIIDAKTFDCIDKKIDTVINCAANVSHFAYGDVLKSVNVEAVETIVNFCKMKQASLVHISTISIAGHYLGESIYGKDNFTENNLFDNQIISNEYVYSKFLAEYLLLKEKRRGLKVKIMRVGNLQGRMDDGEFQINLQENAFIRQLKAFSIIGKVPLNLKTEQVNITPVDETAKAIILLSKLNNSYSVFHVINPVYVPYADIFSCFTCIQKQVEYIETSEFERLIDVFLHNGQNGKVVEGLLIEKSDIRLHEIPVNSDFTMSVLSELGFNFTKIKLSYLENYFKSLNGLGFFDE